MNIQPWCKIINASRPRFNIFKSLHRKQVKRLKPQIFLLSVIVFSSDLTWLFLSIYNRFIVQVPDWKSPFSAQPLTFQIYTLSFSVPGPTHPPNYLHNSTNIHFSNKYVSKTIIIMTNSGKKPSEYSHWWWEVVRVEYFVKSLENFVKSLLF